MPCRRTFLLALALALTLAIVAVFAPSVARAADWPQWLGPDRNGITLETGLLKEWPKDGPKLKWKITDLGKGDAFSTPAIAKGRIYLLAVVGREEAVVALDEKDGSKIWSTKFGKVGDNSPSNDYSGPRSTPTVDGDKLYAFSSGGDIVCLDVANGNKLWGKNVQKEFGGKPGSWAYAESPLVDGDVVLVSPGGKTATILALHKKDGSVAWKCAVPGGDNAAYGSAIRIEFGGVKQYVSVLSKGLVSVAAADGKFLWRYDGFAASNGVNIPTPMYHDGYIFGVAGYKKGGGVAKLSVEDGKFKATKVWFDEQLKTVQQIGGFLRVGDHLYGTALGAKQKIELVCLEFMTGKVVWRDPCVGAAQFCVAEGMLYVRGENNGTVVLVEASPAGYKEHGRLQQSKNGTKSKVWPYPVVANGCLYLRDLGMLRCYEVRDPKLDQKPAAEKRR